MKRDLAIGAYVRCSAYRSSYANLISGTEEKNYGPVYGKIVAVDSSSSLGTFYKVRFGDIKENVVWTDSYSLDLVYNMEKLHEIDRRLSGVFETSPDKLREAFAEALGVKDATGWKTGEAIIEILRRNNV